MKWKKYQARDLKTINWFESPLSVCLSHKSQRFDTRTFSKPFIHRRDDLFIYAEYLVNTDNAKVILQEIIQENWHAGAVVSQGWV